MLVDLLVMAAAVQVMLVPTVLPEVSEMWVCQVMTELTVKRDLRVTVAAMVRPGRWVHPAHVVQQGMLEETVTSVWMARLDLKEVLAQTDLQVCYGLTSDGSRLWGVRV